MEFDNVIDSFGTLSVDNQIKPIKPIGVYNPEYSERGWMKTNHGSNSNMNPNKDVDDLTYMFGNINTFNSHNSHNTHNTNFLGQQIYEESQYLCSRQQHQNSSSVYYNLLDDILQGNVYFGHSLIFSLKNYFKEYLAYACRKDFNKYPESYVYYKKIKEMIENINKKEYKNDTEEIAIIREAGEILNIVVIAETR